MAKSSRTYFEASHVLPVFLSSMINAKPQHPLAENISAVVKMEQRILDDRTTIERIGDALGSFAGSMSFVALHVLVFTFWFLVNAKVVPGISALDAFRFIHLSMIVSVEAVLLSTFVLMKQNRESKRAEHRQQLTLQIGLLTEQESTKCLQVLQLVCDRLGIESVSRDTETRILSQDTLVDKLADELKSRLPPE